MNWQDAKSRVKVKRQEEEKKKQRGPEWDRLNKIRLVQKVTGGK